MCWSFMEIQYQSRKKRLWYESEEMILCDLDQVTSFQEGPFPHIVKRDYNTLSDVVKDHPLK